MITDVYKAVLEEMPPEHIDHWCSDLYLKITPISRKIINNYKYKHMVTRFTSNIDGDRWYEIPFAYYGKNWRG